MSRIATFIAVLALGSVTSCSNEGNKTLALMGDMDTSALITLGDAIDIAVAEVPGSFAVEAELEIEDDDGENEPPAYEVVVYVQSTSQLIEVEVHAISGAVLEIEVEDEDDDDDDLDDD